MTGMPAKPKIVDKWLHVAQDGYAATRNYFENRVDRGIQGKPTFIVLHIQQGSSRNSWGWFHQVQASSHIFANRDGSIWRLVEEKHGAWTNGDDIAPTSIGQRLVDLPGNSNIWSLTIETEGFSYEPNDFGWASWPKPEAQLNAVVWQIVTWMKQYNIPLRNVIRHKDVNTRDKMLCPGDDYFAEVINRVRAITGSTGGTVTYVEPQPVVVNGIRWDGTKDVVLNGITFHGEPRPVKAGKNGANFRQWASRDAALTRGYAVAGTEFAVLGWVVGEDVNKETRWWITKAGARVHVLDTVERPGQLPADPPEPDENPYDQVINGIRFHAVRTDSNAPIEVTAAKQDVPVHKYATPTSAILRAPLHKGEKFYAQFWVEGRTFEGDKRWWVTTYGSRIPVSGTVEKP